MMNIGNKVNVNMDVLRSAVSSLIARQLAATGQDPSQADAVTEQLLSCGKTARGEFEGCLDRETECRIRAAHFPSIYSRNAVIKDVTYDSLDNYGVLVDIIEHLTAFSSSMNLSEQVLTRTAEREDRMTMHSTSLPCVIALEAEIQLPKDVLSGSGTIEFSQLQSDSGASSVQKATTPGEGNSGALLGQKATVRVEGNSATLQFIIGWQRPGASRNLPRAVRIDDASSWSISGFPAGTIVILRYGTVHDMTGQSVLNSVAGSLV